MSSFDTSWVNHTVSFWPMLTTSTRTHPCWKARVTLDCERSPHTDCHLASERLWKTAASALPSGLPWECSRGVSRFAHYYFSWCRPVYPPKKQPTYCQLMWLRASRQSSTCISTSAGHRRRRATMPQWEVTRRKIGSNDTSGMQMKLKKHYQ